MIPEQGSRSNTKTPLCSPQKGSFEHWVCFLGILIQLECHTNTHLVPTSATGYNVGEEEVVALSLAISLSLWGEADIGYLHASRDSLPQSCGSATPVSEVRKQNALSIYSFQTIFPEFPITLCQCCGHRNKSHDHFLVFNAKSKRYP